MNKSFYLSIFNLALILVLIVLGVNYLKSNKHETLGYVDNVRLFNEFNMTKDLRSVEQPKLLAKKRQLDSLYTLLQNIDKKDSSKFEKIQSEISLASREFQQIQEHLSTNTTQQVWDRLNGYIKEYGEKKKMKLIFGTTGNGNIMYSEAMLNITDSIIVYCNKKYEGN